MKVEVLKCNKCGNLHAFEKLELKDRHRCECGATLDKWSNYKGVCDVEEASNEPYISESARRAKANHRDPRYPTKGITVELDCKTTESFNETLDKLRETLIQPVIITDKTKALLFNSNLRLTGATITELEAELRDRLGLKCVILNKGIELAAVIE